MVQNQLIDYINAQFKAGVSRDMVRNALVGVGWQTTDVDDTLKKVEDDAHAAASSSVRPSAMSVDAARPAATSQVRPQQPQASPTSTSPSIASMANTTRPAATSPIGTMPARGTGSFSPMDVMGGVATGGKGGSYPVTSRSAVVTTSSTPAKGEVYASHTGERVGMVAEAIGLVALAALSVYFYTQNSALKAQVGSSGASDSTAAQAADLASQVQILTASNTALVANVNMMTPQLTDLKTQIRFFATPSLGATVTATGTITGVLNSSISAKGVYSIRTPYDALVWVKNGTDPKVAAMLKLLVGSTTTVAGSYVVGSDAITVISVNGTLVNPPTVATTTTMTASSTATSTATTTTP